MYALPRSSSTDGNILGGEVQQYIAFDNLLPRSLRYNNIIMIYRYRTIG